MIRFKNSNYSLRDFQVAVQADHLAHPARVRILTYLLDNRKADFKLLEQLTGLAPGMVRRHLHELTEAGFIYMQSEGFVEYYKLDKQQWAQMRIIFLEFLRSENSQNG